MLASTLNDGIAWIVLAPFLAALVAPLVWRLAGRGAGWLLALVPAAITAFLVAAVGTVASGQPLRFRLAWIPSLGLDLALRLDGLGLLFALCVAGVGVFVILYSGPYLDGHPHQGRFFALLLAFMGAMLGIVLADSLVALYGFWELTAVTSFLLIGFDHVRSTARRAAVQALLVTSGGGLALLLGALLLQHAAGSWDLSTLAGQGAALRAGPAYVPIFVLFVVAAFTKSAQFPFQFWLPNAMEAPTPVSAYLHSAAMVQAGVYLLARLSPLLGGTLLWSATLVLFGGVTLLWGGVHALRQTDLKQMLAQTTIASLGLLVLLLGIGTEAAIVGAVLYFIGHAAYKAGFFLIAGLIDHETGRRDIIALGGLRDRMALSFIAAILAGFGMLGLPPALAYLAKEEMYAVSGAVQGLDIGVMAVLLVGNAALGAVALALVVRPFTGPLSPTPLEPHEGPVAMLLGPLALGIAGIAAALALGWTGGQLVNPAVAAITGHAVAGHFGFTASLTDPAIWLSLLTWALAGVLFWRLDLIRTRLRRVESALGWSFDRGFDAAMAALIRAGALSARFGQHGRLRFYLLPVFGLAALALLVPLLGLGGWPGWPEMPALQPAEWGVLGLAVIGISAVLLAPTALIAIIALGVQGLALALIFALFGAPDLSFTQFMVETLSVVMFALAMTRLRLEQRQRRSGLAALRDGLVAAVCGIAVTLVLLADLQTPLDTRLSAFFAANAAVLAHGRNIVNVILVDFRGLDTLGEISVVLTAGVAVLALLGARRRTGAASRGATAAGATSGRCCRRRGDAVNTLIFRTSAPLIVAVMLMFAVFVLLRGHNAPGGGFIAGLIAAAAVAIHGMSVGPSAVRRALRVPPIAIGGLGVFIAAASGLLSLGAGAPFLTGLWTFVHLGQSEIALSTPLLFDLGVGLTVFGTVSSIVLALEADGEGG